MDICVMPVAGVSKGTPSGAVSDMNEPLLNE